MNQTQARPDVEVARLPQRAAARSYLFAPGHRPDRFDKAWASAADELILDLEDAVAIDQKDDARTKVLAWLRPKRPVLVRINAADSPWYRKDVDLIDHAGVAGLMVPKSERLDGSLVRRCTAAGKKLVPIVETALGFRAASELAATSSVERLAFGTLDFQVDLGINGDDDALLYFRSQLVLESRLAGLAPPIDGVTTDIENKEMLQSDTRRSKRLGFGAKLCIHPAQLEVVNSEFSPSADEVKWAQRVIQAIAQADGAAIALDGKMVDRPVILKAERVLQLSTPVRRAA